MKPGRFLVLSSLSVLAASTLEPAAATNVTSPPIATRFGGPVTDEVPDFQRHVLPMMSRVGCNGRACHGSFQGQGGFRLSLFGYDFEADHAALRAEDVERLDLEVPELSLALQKPTLGVPHKGGKVLEEDSWQYRVLFRWIEAGARPAARKAEFESLEVTPSEIRFQTDGERVPLRVIAHWSDGTSEDVTCITRFQTNDESIAEIDPDGVVTSRGRGDTHVVAFYDNGVAAIPVLRPLSDRVGDAYPEIPTPTEIDRLVVDKLRKLGIVPSDVCSDAEFLRRVSLDLTGTLPTPREVESFQADSGPDKRRAKVEELLDRPTYAAWWTNRLSDFLGNSPGSFQGLSGAPEYARQWYQWMYRRIAENRPYDEIMAGIILASSRQPAQDYEDYAAEMSSYFRKDDPADFAERDSMPYFWARRNLRLPEEKALGFSYAFLGVRLDCAQCHKHPFDQWTQQDFQQFQAFFDRIRYGPSRESGAMQRTLLDEMGFDPQNPRQNRNQFLRSLYGRLVEKEGKPYPWDELNILPLRRPPRRPQPDASAARRGASRVVPPKVLGGDTVDSSNLSDPRVPLMEWLRDPQNPYFARAFVNRVWANYFGRGIVDPPDDMNLANPPSNGPLLDHLASGFVEHGFDMKWLHREIILSATYQRSWTTNETNRHDDRHFSHAKIRRLPAEVILDAIMQATSASESLATVNSDLAGRGIGPDGTVRLRRGGGGYADNVFGRSARDTNCDCSRSDEPNLLQLIFLQNDPELLGRLDRSDGWIAELKAESRGPSGVDASRKVEFETWVHEAFARTLSRSPDSKEIATALSYLEGSQNSQDGLRDLLWALLNTKEFMTNH